MRVVDVMVRGAHDQSGGIDMRRRKIYLVAILAAVMALQTPVMAFAEGDTTAETGGENSTGGDNTDDGATENWNINGDVTITDDSSTSTDTDNPTLNETGEDSLKTLGAYGGQTVTVNGDVASSTSVNSATDDDGNQYSPVAVEAIGNGSSLVVNGDVSSANTGAIWADEEGTVKVTGNVTSNAEEEPAIAIGESGGTVNVGGDVTAASGIGILSADGNGTVKVDGSVSSSGNNPAIVTNDSSSITVGKDVSGDTGITIVIENSDGSGKVEVLGTVKSTVDNHSVITIETDKTDKDELIAALPTIIVGGLEGAAGSPDDYLWISSEEDMDEAVVGEVYEAVFNQMLYYIAQDKFANASLSVSGANSYANGWTSKEGNSLTVTITTADGYEVSSVSGASVVRNADGTYTVVVQRGKGIDINAVISAIEKAQKDISGSGGNNSNSSNSSSNSAAAEVVIPAYAVVQKQFQTVIAVQLRALPAGGTLTLDMKDYISFNRKTFEILSKRKDVDIKIIYTWKGKRYAVVIPAGYDILSLLDANGYCGCLYLNSIFGSTELTK